METTPERLAELPEGSIFVFGSNATGAHGGGAAKVALDRFGAIWGQGEGLQGQSYGLPTMEGFDALRGAAERFVTFAGEHPELRFYLTKVGCGIAGHDESDVAPSVRRDAGQRRQAPGLVSGVSRTAQPVWACCCSAIWR